jgi:LacI family transcriptional regulator
VLAAADELGFVPSVQAAALARQGTGRIGVMAPFTSYASYLRRLAGVLSAASARGIDVVVFDHESAALASAPVLANMPIHGRLDGLIVMGLKIEESIAERLHRRGLPTVAVDADSAVFSRVVVDDVEGGRIGARHLVELGHRRLGYLLERQVSDYQSQAVKRLAGFRQVAKSARCQAVAVEVSGNSVEDARAGAARLLDAADPPTAVMAHYDLLAVGVLLAARDRGLRVPEDVAVLGFDDGDLALGADLSTVRQPFQESGRTAVEVLLAESSARRRSTTVLEVEVVRRSTT